MERGEKQLRSARKRASKLIFHMTTLLCAVIARSPSLDLSISRTDRVKVILFGSRCSSSASPASSCYYYHFSGRRSLLMSCTMGLDTKTGTESVAAVSTLDASYW